MAKKTWKLKGKLNKKTTRAMRIKPHRSFIFNYQSYRKECFQVVLPMNLTS